MVYAQVGLKYRRRVLQKTNYKKRFALLKSNLPRLVARVSNMYLNLQYVLHNSIGDESKVNLLSKSLSKYGYEGSYKNLTASYLTGYLFGKIVISKKLSEKMIFDIGMHKLHKGGKLFSAIKGAVDSGIDIEADSDYFPKDDRLNMDLIKKVKVSIDKEF